ncbi:MAG: tetratricopeptide repeat protein, partial [Duncaniella sp.]|nr:tetratricopeptide repeat protein [Duncaniella sp.]
YYEQSELLNSESRWTIRRLASCCRTLGRWEEALGYYRRLADSKPDDVSTALNIGLSLVKLRRYDEALQYLFKAEFLGNSSEKAIRAIAWCTLLGADYTRCAKYTDILLSSSPTANDLLNAGHLAILTGRPADAADYWARSLAARDFDAQSLISEIESDRATIGGYSGIDPVLVGMVADNAVSRARTIGNQL